MTLLVPYDGTALAEAALARAVMFGDTLNEPVMVVSVIPEGNAEYARERGWLDAGEPFTMDAVTAHLREQVTEQAPEATVEFKRVGRNARPGTISKELRRVARDVGAKMVFVGSDNAGRLVTSLSSVGGNVAADQTYDVVIVRHTKPFLVAAEELEDSTETQRG